MANRKITVLNPSGYQEIFQSGDNLIVDGTIDIQSNSLTGIPTPQQNLDAVNKNYTDTADNLNDAKIQDNTNLINSNSADISTNTNNISTNTNNISTLDTRLTTVESDLSSLSPNETQVNFQGTQGISFPNESSFNLNQSTDSTITFQGPDLSTYLEVPTLDGSYILTKSGTNIVYSEVIDGGEY